jgi:hypothetical protein
MENSIRFLLIFLLVSPFLIKETIVVALKLRWIWACYPLLSYARSLWDSLQILDENIQVQCQYGWRQISCPSERDLKGQLFLFFLGMQNPFILSSSDQHVFHVFVEGFISLWWGGVLVGFCPTFEWFCGFSVSYICGACCLFQVLKPSFASYDHVVNIISFSGY